MFLRVVKISGTFFLLYMLILLAFACSFFIMTSSESGLFSYLNYSYMIGVGDYNTDFTEYHTPEMMQIFFLVATLIVQIVMLNILIAIVSSAYDEVTNTQQEANDFERVNLIADTADFISQKVLDQVCKPNWYLIKAQKVTSDE